MTEQKIEAKIIEAFAALNISGLRIVGAWQPAATNAVKAYQDGSVKALLAVKVEPRQYETPTIPDASFSATVALDVRADVDAAGSDYLTMTDALAAVLHAWQKTYSSYSAALAVANEFTPTGFRLDGGTCGFDADKCVWSWSQEMTIQGVIQ